jgi:uncharacterized membrane protein
MIHNPFGLIAILISIECFVLSVSKTKWFEKYLNFLPSVFWIYFLPMIFSTLGIIDSKSPLYQLITTYILPASLFLLLLSADIKSIMKLGWPALIMMHTGSLGIMVGTPIAFVIVKPWINSGFWAGFGALSASWTGGSANMIAVKEALGTPDSVFLPMVIVDTIVPYVWMGILVAFVSLQGVYDKWNKSDRSILNDIHVNMTATKDTAAIKVSLLGIIISLILAFCGGFIAQIIARKLPVIKDILSTYAWMIIVVSILGIAFSFTKLRSLEKKGSSKIGSLLLYFVLTSIGAKANISNIGSTFILIGAGFLIVLIHAIFLLVMARIIKAPLFLVATASQANIGGVASAPLVAAVYEPQLASVGLLLAIFGNIIGTYLGIITAQVCRYFA